MMGRVAEVLNLERGVDRRVEWMVAFFGTSMVSGLFLDGWAHNANKPESFFSPWHAVLYSGFIAAMVFTGLEALRQRSRGEVTRMDPLMAAGIGLFVAGGAGDMVWHEIFGIEVGVEALLSPTHLLLMGGGILMASTPFRMAWGDGPAGDRERTASLRAFLPTIMSLTLVVGLVSFFVMYASAFRTSGLPSFDPDSDGLVVALISAVLITNVLLVGPMLLVLRRWSPPAGSFTLLFTLVGVAMVSLDGFARWQLVIPAVIAGLAADGAARRLSPRGTASLVPAVLWGAWFVVVGQIGGVTWTPELWSGTIVLTVLTGIGLSYLTFPPTRALTAELHGENERPMGRGLGVLGHAK
jgi:hypothetical protein